MDFSTVELLEIGDHYYFKATYPERTTLLWTGRRPPATLAREAYEDCTPRRLARAIADSRRGRFGIVVAYATLQSPWHPRYWLRSLAATPRAPIAALTRVFGVSLLRLADLVAPVVAIDMHDAFTIG